MHTLEPFHGWRKYYTPESDPHSPYFGKEYNYDVYSDTIYGYYIDPAWDFFGSESLYFKILFIQYELRFCVIEFIGEWNDALHNDIMHLKRNIVDHLNRYDIIHYVLIGENVMNFHGSDDSYYEEWYEDIEDGWITAIGFRDFVIEEWKKFNVDGYINFGGSLDIYDWRTQNPRKLFERINKLITYRLE